MKRIVVIGDIMLDKYVFTTNRPNPESSAPCYTVQKEESRLGGAGNVAANLKSLDSNFLFLGVVGGDLNAQLLLDLIKQNDIPNYFFRDNNKSTIVKVRYLSTRDGRYHSRVDYEKKEEINSNYTKEFSDLIKKDDIVLVSDYNKGTISENLMEKIKMKTDIILIDPKPEHKNFYKGVFMITPNVEEAKKMSGLEDEMAAAEKIKVDLSSRILLTRGEKGVSYFGHEKRLDFPSEAEENDVVDVTGAGDTLIATLAYCLANDFGIEKSIRISNRAAGIAVKHAGCYCIKKEELF